MSEPVWAHISSAESLTQVICSTTLRTWRQLVDEHTPSHTPHMFPHGFKWLISIVTAITSLFLSFPSLCQTIICQSCMIYAHYAHNNTFTHLRLLLNLHDLKHVGQVTALYGVLSPLISQSNSGSDLGYFKYIIITIILKNPLTLCIIIHFTVYSMLLLGYVWYFLNI